MIYVHNLKGRNIYTKLDDVLQIKNPNQKDIRKGYEKLGDAVDSNYQTFTQKMDDLKNKPTINPYKKPEFNPNNSHPSMSKKSQKVKAIVNENSFEEVFIKAFTNAIRENSDQIKNSDSCVNQISKNFLVKMNDGNKNEEVTEKKIEKKSKYQKEDLEFVEKINSKVERNRKIYGNDLEQENNSHPGGEVHSNRGITQKKEVSNKNVQFKKKLEKVLFGSLNYLYFNNVSIVEFLRINPFPAKPFSLKYSYEFFEAVKFDKKSEVEELIKKDRGYVFEFDYFHQTGYHWAAKRGYKDMLELLISKGNHINQFDNQKRTPLFLAALNNHYEACAVLIAYDANPFFENKEGKKPSEVTTEENVKLIIQQQMDNRSEMGGASFFKTNVMKKHKNDAVNLLNKDIAI